MEDIYEYDTPRQIGRDENGKIVELGSKYISTYNKLGYLKKDLSKSTTAQYSIIQNYDQNTDISIT